MKTLLKSLVLLTILASFFQACKNGQNMAAAALEKEIMAIHDELMPKMGDLSAAKEKLTGALASLDTMNANYPAMKTKVGLGVDYLAKAGTSMSDWMAGYHVPTGVSADSLMSYLNGQKVAASKMKETFTGALDNAGALLKEFAALTPATAPTAPKATEPTKEADAHKGHNH